MKTDVSKKDLDKWIGSVITGRDRNSFPDLRKHVQSALVQALLVDGIAGTPVNGDVAYALMLLLVGRGIVPQFREVTQGANLPGFAQAEQYYQDFDPEHLSPDVATAAILARTVEVTNEFVFGTIENAILILNEGIRIWPEIGELRRQSGIIAIAQRRYAEAITNLEEARALNPGMVHLKEPLERAIALNTLASAAAAGNYTTINVPTFNRTPIQVLLLDVSTFGLYMLYYLIRNYHLAQIRFNDKRRPWWSWLGLLIPIVNVYFYYGSFSYIGKRVEASGVKVYVPFGIQALILFCFGALYRLPGAWAFLALLNSVVLANMHSRLAKAEAIDFPLRSRPKMTAWEIGILVVGFLFIGLAVWGTLLPSSA